MLNDLYDVERGLAAHGVAISTQHPDVKDMAKGGAILVRLDAQGAIDALQFVAESGNGALWTLRDGQHNGFPGLKTGQPGNPKSNKPDRGLLALDDGARAAHERVWSEDKSPAARRRETLRLANETPFDAESAAAWPNAGHRKRIAERLAQLSPLRDDPKAASVPAVFERFLRALERPPSFLADLFEHLKERLRNGGDEWIEPVRGALIGPAAIYIDVVEDDFPRDAHDRRQVAAVSAALNATAAPKADKGGAICALSGAAARLHSGNFPQPNLPGLGQTYLFSRNSDIPSLTRYGRTADASFAVGADLLGRLSGAVSFLTRPEKCDKIWRLVPAESGDKPDLMIAFCPAAPEAALVSHLSADDDDDEAPTFADFEAKARQVIAQSHGEHAQAAARKDVSLLVLRAVDPANRKAIYHRTVSAEAYFKAAQEWRQHPMDNAPSWIGFGAPQSRGTRGSPIVLRRPPSVRPLSLTPLSRVIFAEGGRRRVDAIGLPASVAFALFLQEGDVAGLARRALRLLIQRHGALLSGLAQAARKGGDALKSFDPKFDLRLDALRSVSWFGALLHRLGRYKEVYMSSAAFRLGQLLAAADVVHVGYCIDVRNGSIPAALLGNGLLNLAGANPHKALSLLCQRWPPYSHWATAGSAVAQDPVVKKQTSAETKEQKRERQNGISIRRAFRHARLAKEVSAALLDQLRETQLPTDDVFKAELLLGYIAGFPPAQKKNDGDIAAGNPDDTDEGDEQ